MPKVHNFNNREPVIPRNRTFQQSSFHITQERKGQLCLRSCPWRGRRCSQIKPPEAGNEIPERSHRTQHPSLPMQRAVAGPQRGHSPSQTWRRPAQPAGAAGQRQPASIPRGLPPRAGFPHGWHLNPRLGLRAAAADAERPRVSSAAASSEPPGRAGTD